MLLRLPMGRRRSNQQRANRREPTEVHGVTAVTAEVIDALDDDTVPELGQS